MTGRSCHGSMPWEGLNPLEHGGAIVAEAARRYDARDGFLDHPFLGHGTRTASWAQLDTPSDCAVPERFIFRFDRRLTVGETPEQAVRDVEALDAVSAARAAGLQVDVTMPALPREDLARLPGRQPADLPGLGDARGPSRDPRRGRGVPRGRDAPRRRAARAEQRRARCAASRASTAGSSRPTASASPSRSTTRRSPSPRRSAGSSRATSSTRRCSASAPGIEQNTHRIGECVDLRELQHAIAVLARFPSAFAAI